MAAPGWYGDPTREGRLRYWDGSAWTEHVSEGGQTSSDPIDGVPPAPPSPPPPAEPAAPGAGARAPGYPPTPLGRAGFGVAAVGAIVAAAATGSVAVTQDALGERSVEVAGAGWVAVCAVIGALCVGAAVAPWPWARVAGVGISTAFGAFVSFALIAIRGDEIFRQGLDVSLDTGGWLLLLGSLLLFAGTALALVGLRRPVAGPDPAGSPGQGKAVASLVLGIVGIPLLVTAAPALALALSALDDVRAGAGGRGMAIAGLVLGIVALSLWALGLTLGMLLAQP
jgi:hypothetical protein